VRLHRIVAKHPNGAVVGLQQAAHQPNRRRLTRTIRPDEPEHLAALDRERQIAHRHDRAYFFVTRSSSRAFISGLPFTVYRLPFTVLYSLFRLPYSY
jgi:hypothetical protein